MSRRASTVREIVDELKKQKATCEKWLKTCQEAIEEPLEPRLVWLQEKERFEKMIRDIGKSLENFSNLLERLE